MKRILTLWLLLAGVALAQSWHTLKEEGFQIQFPSEPKKIEAAAWEVDHNSNSYRLSVDTCEGTPDEVFASAKDEFSKSFTFVSEKALTVDGHQAKQFKFTLEGTAIECLMVVKESKLYMLMMIVGGSADEAKKVLSSLHLS
ncbi:hypothetical protein DYH09_00295 [bacterium CPR1]|nr:hypothetical protein [bacterium CPR1]